MADASPRVCAVRVPKGSYCAGSRRVPAAEIGRGRCPRSLRSGGTSAAAGGSPAFGLRPLAPPPPVVRLRALPSALCPCPVGRAPSARPRRAGRPPFVGAQPGGGVPFGGCAPGVALALRAFCSLLPPICPLSLLGQHRSQQNSLAALALYFGAGMLLAVRRVAFGRSPAPSPPSPEKNRSLCGYRAYAQGKSLGIGVSF